jgi:hypothetical protein
MDRRMFLGGLAALTAAPVKAAAALHDGISPALRDRALAAFARHRHHITRPDVLGIVDYARPSRSPRFHLLDMVSGQTETLLVAHGRGSDPAHSGWLERFSNAHGSHASSEGAFLTASEYSGQHGRSMRLHGLEPSNDAAFARAIVIHSADYVTPERAASGKLGRSFGCFTVTAEDLPKVLARLGQGRLLYADKG